MKAKDFAQFLKMYADILACEGIDASAAGLNAVANLFTIKPTVNSAQICKSLHDANTNKSASTDVSRLVDQLRGLERLLAPHAKKSLVNDLQCLADALEPHRASSISDFTEAARVKLEAVKPPKTSKTAEVDLAAVDRHLRRLETALGDEAGFIEAFEGVKQDPSLKTHELKRLARDFAKESPKTKAQAFKLIWGRHASLMQARAKGAATAGRTAA